MKRSLSMVFIVASLAMSCSPPTAIPHPTPLTGAWYHEVTTSGEEYLMLMPDYYSDPFFEMPAPHMFCDPELYTSHLKMYIVAANADGDKPCRLWYEDGKQLNCGFGQTIANEPLVEFREYVAYDGFGHGLGETTLNQLMLHRRLYFEFTTRDTSALRNYNYDLSGLRRASLPLRTNCRLP